MQDSGLTGAYANFHFSLFHCNYLIPSNTILPSTERHSEIKQMCTCPQEEHVADNVCRAVTTDLAAFQIFGLAFSHYSTIQLIRVSRRVHRQPHDPWVSQGNLVCLLAPWRTYEQNFSELISEQVRLVAGLRSFYTCGPTHGRPLCLCRNYDKKNLLCLNRCFDVR